MTTAGADRDLGDTGRDRHRRFAIVLTYERDRVVAAARSLLERIWGEPHHLAHAAPALTAAPR